MKANASHPLDRVRYTVGIINPGDMLKGIQGGSTGFIKSIIPYLKAEKVIIYGISKTNATPWKSVIIQKNVEFVPICKLKDSSRIPMRLKAFLNFLRYRKKILNSGVDVLYIQTPECCLPFLNGNKGIPVIYHQHGSGNPVALSRFTYARKIFFQRLFEIILRNIYKRSDWIIAIDKLCLKKAIKNGAQRKTTLIMNAIDTQAFRPNSNYRIKTRHCFGMKPKQYAIFFIGRIVKTKGPDRLLTCIPFLRKAGFPFRIFFVGEGNYLPSIRNYISKGQYADCVTLLGHIAHEDLPYYYNMADVVVLPSDMEGVPMVILEALACGAPVVASCVGGIPDIITEGKNGILVRQLSTENLASSIIRALALENDRKDISDTVFKYSATRFVTLLNNIISTVIDNRRSALKN
jgi:glycosyltransferase involved in cell wall biosynthesis